MVRGEKEREYPEDNYPEFPFGGSGHAVRLTREASFRAWVGPPERLAALEVEIEKALKAEYDQHLAKLVASDQHPGAANALIKNLRLRSNVTANNGRLTRTGSMTAILAEMDLRDIEKITMGNESDGGFPEISLTMRRDSDNNFRSVRVKVTGSDRQWVGGAYDVLAAELQKAVPRWAVMRSPLFAVLVGVAIALGIAGVLIATGRANSEDLVTAAILSLFLGAMSGGLLLTPLFGVLFPGLEVVKSGSTARGRRTFGYVGAAVSLLLSVAGVVLGLIAL
jgi:hypothetical protein